MTSMAKNMPLRRALVVEDYADAAAWFSAALREAFPGIQVHVSATLAQGREALATVRPEIALIDLGLPDGSGLDLITLLRLRSPPVPTVVTTAYDDSENILSALRAGACGYLLKEESQDTLVRQLIEMVRGEFPLSPSVAQQVMRYFSSLGPDAVRLEQLTDKEREVLKHIAAGRTLSGVGQTLGISRNTVHTHVKRIYEKLGVSSRAEATLIAARVGLIRL